MLPEREAACALPEREAAGTAGLADTVTARSDASIGIPHATAIRTQRGAEKVESDLIKSFKSRVKVDDWTGEPSIVRGACEVVTVPALWRLTAHAELTREHEQFL